MTSSKRASHTEKFVWTYILLPLLASVGTIESISRSCSCALLPLVIFMCRSIPVLLRLASVPSSNDGLGFLRPFTSSSAKYFSPSIPTSPPSPLRGDAGPPSCDVSEKPLGLAPPRLASAAFDAPPPDLSFASDAGGLVCTEITWRLSSRGLATKIVPFFSGTPSTTPCSCCFFGPTSSSSMGTILFSLYLGFPANDVATVSACVPSPFFISSSPGCDDCPRSFRSAALTRFCISSL